MGRGVWPGSRGKGMASSAPFRSRRGKGMATSAPFRPFGSKGMATPALFRPGGARGGGFRPAWIGMKDDKEQGEGK